MLFTTSEYLTRWRPGHNKLVEVDEMVLLVQVYTISKRCIASDNIIWHPISKDSYV